MSVKQPILITRNLVKQYSTTGGTLEVLKGIDLEIYPGEIIAMVGASGVGKSTLLNILGALDRPTSGEVEIDGAFIAQLNDQALAQFRNRTIGFVFQFHHLLPEFSALENVMMPALIARRNGSGVVERAKQLADLGVDSLCINRRGFKRAKSREERIAQIHDLISTIQLPVFIAGGIDLAELIHLRKLPLAGVLVGACIADADSPAAMAEKMRALLDWRE